MTLLLHVFLGFTTSFLGLLMPSMLNITALKISMEKDTYAVIKYAVGVSVVVLLQAYIAILLTQYIRENMAIIELLKKIAIVIFIGLSAYFFYQSKKERKKNSKINRKNNNPFLVGVFLAVLNMFAIPFYCSVATIFNLAGWLHFQQKTILFFSIGCALGTFTILAVYGSYSNSIQQRIGQFVKDINLVLGFLTGIIAVFTIIKFYI